MEISQNLYNKILEAFFSHTEHKIYKECAFTIIGEDIIYVVNSKKADGSWQVHLEGIELSKARYLIYPKLDMYVDILTYEVMQEGLTDVLNKYTELDSKPEVEKQMDFMQLLVISHLIKEGRKNGSD